MNSFANKTSTSSRTCGGPLAWTLTAILLCANLNIALGASIPRLPESVTAPEAITLNCVASARSLPALEVCRSIFEVMREAAEEYNQRIARFCRSLNAFDAALRAKASSGRIGWDDYDDLKERILAELAECSPDSGDYYAPYRSRMREYRAALKLHNSRRKDLIRRPALL
jgi:hypothetical protein